VLRCTTRSNQEQSQKKQEINANPFELLHRDCSKEKSYTRYSKRIRFTSFPIGNSMVSTYEYISSNFRNKIKDRRQIMTATVYDGGLNRVYSTQWRPHSSNRFAKWLAAVNPFSLPHKWDHHTSRWRFQHKISITARVQLLADRPCSPNPLLDIFSWKAYRTAEKLNSTMIYRSLIQHPCNTHDCNFLWLQLWSISSKIKRVMIAITQLTIHNLAIIKICWIYMEHA